MQKLTLVLAVALLLPGVSTAATVTITYNITGRRVFADQDPEDITGGQFKVTLPAAAKYSLRSGPGTLQSFCFMAAGVTSGQNKSTTVTAALTAPAAVYGYLTGRFVAIETLRFTGNKTVHSDSTTQVFPLLLLVRYGYDFPNSSAAFSPGDGSGSLFFGVYSPVGGATGYDNATVQFTGQEVMGTRVFTPEPGGTWLAMSALASLCGLNLWARRRRGA